MKALILVALTVAGMTFASKHVDVNSLVHEGSGSVPVHTEDGVTTSEVRELWADQ